MTQHRTRAIWTGVIAVSAAGAMLLTGCTTGGGGSEGPQEITFTFATSNNLESPYEVLAQAYMDENADVTIVTNPTPNDKYGETIRTQLQAGNASDVIQTTPGSGERAASSAWPSRLPRAARRHCDRIDPRGKRVPVPDRREHLWPALDFTIGSVVASPATRSGWASPTSSGRSR